MRYPVAWLDATVLAERVAHRVAPAAGSPRATVLVDADLTTHPVVAATESWLRQHNYHPRQQSLRLDAGTGGGRGVIERVNGLLRDSPDLVLAIGGGSLLDAAKLATLALGNDRFVGCLTVPQRGGMVLAPAGTVRPAPLIAIPTTVGTGAESSRVAVLSDPTSRRLVMGTGLRPEAKVLDPLATLGLPPHLLAEGVAEVLARVVGPYVGDHHALPTMDGLAEAVATRIVQLADTLTDRLPDGAGDPELRLDIARLSSLSHSEWLARDGNPYAVKGWLLANELAFATGVRKMTATIALWPALWDHIDSGDGRLGSPARLRALWSVIRRAHEGALPAAPGPGIARLLDRWGLAAPLSATAAEVRTAVHAVNRSWGAGLPMLGGLRPADVRELISAAVTIRYPGAGTGRRPA